MARIKGTRLLGEARAAHQTKASFNKAMRMDARDRLPRSGVKPRCAVCGAEESLTVHHIRSISSFADSDPVGKVNDPGNLEFLCDLHHRVTHYGSSNLRTDAK